MMMHSFSSEREDGEQGCINDSGRLLLDNITRNDRVVIKTNNSVYRFMVANAALRQGMLTGGALNDASRSAILIGSIIEGANGRASETPGLKVGARAVFYLISPAGMERLITSVVINLTLIRGDKTPPLPKESSDHILMSQSFMPA